MPSAFQLPEASALNTPVLSTHKPRILMLYGSARERSYSRFLTFEAQRLLEAFGCEPRVFDPRGLPLPDSVPDTHAKVQELLPTMSGMAFFTSSAERLTCSGSMTPRRRRRSA